MRSIITTIVEVAALGLVAYGVWLIFPPAAFIFAGGSIVAVSFWKNR